MMHEDKDRPTRAVLTWLYLPVGMMFLMSIPKVIEERTIQLNNEYGTILGADSEPFRFWLHVALFTVVGVVLVFKGARALLQWLWE